MQKNKITFVCAMKDVVIPYGVINTNEDGKIEEMVEKPELSFLTNTGVYVIEPEVIEELNENEFIHLPDIAKRYMEKGENIGVFPISEKAWFDMGQFSEMENMMKELGV
jgi:NDP-sugar pyrophosphorylase family protein